MGRRLKADLDQRQLGLFGDGLALGHRPKVTKSLPVAASQPPKSETILKQQRSSVISTPAPRKSLNNLPPEVVRPAEAACLLSVSLSLLKKWRVQGGGPRFVRLGGRAIGYRRAELSDWIAARIS